MLPVPVEARIYLAIVAGYLAKTEGHPCKRDQREEQEDGNGICGQCSCRWMFHKRAETGNCPHKKNEGCWSPENKGTEITPRDGRRGSLGRVGLTRPRIERTGVCACPLLVENGRSHDVRGSALVALVRIQLRYGCHSVVPDLATACDTSPFD